jgi:hypothetical protein
MDLSTSKGLIEYAFHLRQYGERAPGGSETWREWDVNAEIWLRSHDHPHQGTTERCARCEVQSGEHIG